MNFMPIPLSTSSNPTQCSMGTPTYLPSHLPTLPTYLPTYPPYLPTLPTYLPTYPPYLPRSYLSFAILDLIGRPKYTLC